MLYISCTYVGQHAIHRKDFQYITLMLHITPINKKLIGVITMLLVCVCPRGRSSRISIT